MSRMWRGACPELKIAQADPLWAAIHRRAGRHLISCTIADDGRSADFYRLQKINGDWYQFDLGRVEGRDPYSTVLAGYRQYTPFDAELMRQNHDYIERMAEEIAHDCSTISIKVSAAVDAFVQ